MTDPITITYGDGWTQEVAVTVEAGETHPSQSSFNTHNVVVGNGKQATIALTPAAPVNPTPPPPPPSNNPSGQAPPGPDAYPGLTQVLVDDFTGSSLNQQVWNGFYQDPGQSFGAFYSSQGSVSNSCAVIINSVVNGVRAGTGLCTRVGWGSGAVQVRAQATGGAGVTMVLGVIGVNEWPPEIDFYEDNMHIESNARAETYATTHWGSGNQSAYQILSSGFDGTQWHTWGLEWDDQTINYLLDGIVWGTLSNPDPGTSDGYGLGQPQKLFMQLETKDESTVESSTPAVVTMEIDWVSVYSNGASVIDTLGRIGRS